MSGRVGSSPEHVGIVSFLHTIHMKEIHALVMFFFSFYYVLILVASCKMYFVTALTLHVVASKTISYFSNSACMLSRKQSKMLSELREEEEDAE